MLTFRGPGEKSGGKTSRREFLRLGGLGLAGLTLADLLQNDSRAGEQHRPKSIIYVVLNGGPSHIDMWDLKPDAPDEYRGPFKPIATKLPGVQLCEHMPLQAGMMDRLALLRGIRSVENDHFLSEVYSGLPRTSGNRPAFGSIVSRLAEEHLPSPMPPYISLNRPSSDQFEFEKPYYTGPQHGPFRPFGDSLADLKPAKSLDLLNDRRALLSSFDTLRRDLDRPGAVAGLDRFHARAVDIITSPKVREAFDLSREPVKVRESYGKGQYPHQTYKSILYPWPSEQFLLARRLVEAGARVVTLRPGDWDHHSSENGDIFLALKLLMPALDRSLFALCSDLEARGLDKDVLVVVLGEFGRTPKIGLPGPGREHWADAGCAVLFGGGLKMGQVVGETDSRAERSKSGSITFQNVMSTIYQVLGVDPGAVLADFNGRPQFVLDDRLPIAELIA
ncbi:MAG: DUF1501 domain-containing protein [Gemmataceae bacterium]|nr:DUF1501 domain-containing protein [Gemmataceae bacterium]